MSIINSLILSIIQSFCEFLPISSSAHLVLIPWLFKFKTIGLSFDIALHLGTTTAIIIFFREDFKKLILGFLSIFFRKLTIDIVYKKLSILIIISIIPITIFGAILKNYIDLFQNPILISFCLIFFGFALYYIDKIAQVKSSIQNISKTQALIIGFSQVLALIPGVSRSGITITTARILKIDKESAAKFSFIMATPAIIGAAILDFKEIMHNSQSNLLINFIVGFIATVFLSYLVIKYFIKYIQTHDFKIFLYYRIILALIILTVYFYFQ